MEGVKEEKKRMHQFQLTILSIFALIIQITFYKFDSSDFDSYEPEVFWPTIIRHLQKLCFIPVANGSEEAVRSYPIHIFRNNGRMKTQRPPHNNDFLEDFYFESKLSRETRNTFSPRNDSLPEEQSEHTRKIRALKLTDEGPEVYGTHANANIGVPLPKVQTFRKCLGASAAIDGGWRRGPWERKSAT